MGWLLKEVKDGIKNARVRGRIGERPKISDRKIKEVKYEKINYFFYDSLYNFMFSKL